MTKPQRVGASVRELKAAALDAFVKQELSKKKAADAAKTARLRALRLARDAIEHADLAPKAKRDGARPRGAPARAALTCSI
jgi:hypothetical protein